MARLDSKNHNDFINLVLYEWATQLIQERKTLVRKTSSIASKELLSSYDFEIRKATIEQTAKLLIAFEKQGRFLDLKKINRKDQQIPVEEIKKWILDQGLGKFKRRRKWYGRRVVSNTRFLNDLAWGIVKKKKRKKHRRRKLQKGMNDAIWKLMTELSEGYLDRTTKEIIQSIKDS